MNFISLAAAAPAAAATAPQENVFMSLVPFLFIFLIFYFLILRPQQKKLKQHQATISSIKNGDKVVLSSGIIGKVTKTDSGSGIIEVNIADNVNVQVVAATISSVDPKNKISNDNAKKAA
jgi:preprotein translocase subunit YajC